MLKFTDQLRNGFAAGRKLRVFFVGLRTAVAGDLSVMIQMSLSLVVLAVSIWLREWVDVLLIIIVTGYMLSAEIFNTVIETICDYVQPNHDARIGAIKDMAAAATGLSILVWTITLLFEVWRLWLALQQN